MLRKAKISEDGTKRNFDTDLANERNADVGAPRRNCMLNETSIRCPSEVNKLRDN